MSSLPFYLAVGTKKTDADDEEYRWIKMDIDAPPRGVEFMRDPTKEMRRDFLKKSFGNRPPVINADVLFQEISDHAHQTDPSWEGHVLQIEHFPYEIFPR